MLSRSRSRSRFELPQYAESRNAAIAAARRNNAALWFAGAPSDLAGFVYQDSTGTTAATGTDPIGLLLDRSYGSSNLGAQTGGNFSNSAGWAFSAGVLTASAAGAFTTSPSVASLSAGLVKLTYTVTVTAGAVRMQFFGTGAQNSTTRSVSGTYTEFLELTEGKSAINAQATGGGFTGTISNFSCQQVLGYPALQATAANKPTLELQANGYYGMRFDGSNDLLTGPAPASLPTSETIIACGAFAAISTTQYLMARRVGASGVMIRCEAAGNIIATGLTGASFGTVDLGAAVLNAPEVLELVAQNNNVQAWRNGAAGTPSITTFVAADTSTSVGLGNISGNAAAGSTMNGKGLLYCWAPAAMSDADRLPIRRFASLLAGL